MGGRRMSKQDLCEVLAENEIRGKTHEELRELTSEYLYDAFIGYSKDTLREIAEKHAIDIEDFWEEEE
jgi:hypothetical protein